MSCAARCISIVTAVLASAPVQADLSQLSFLTGCWSKDGHEPGSLEQWTAPAGRSMLAVNRTVRNGRTVAFEFLRIVELDDGRIDLITSPSGQETTRFSLLFAKSHEVRFENAEHDFPQRISYRLIDDTTLLGWIEGVVNGEQRSVEFPMTKTDCDNTIQAE